MNKQPSAMPNLPNMRLTSLLSKRYDVLTDEFIQQWLYQLYNDYLIDPEYLFVRPQGRQELRKIMNSSPYLIHFARTVCAVDDILNRYPNMGTGTMMHVVVLPTLDEDMLLVGDLLWHEREDVKYLLKRESEKEETDWLEMLKNMGKHR